MNRKTKTKIKLLNITKNGITYLIKQVIDVRTGTLVLPAEILRSYRNG
jgi:hypothetical protein